MNQHTKSKMTPDDGALETASGGHTPGPWEITRYINYVGFAVYAGEYGCVAERWEDIRSPEREATRRANARLIAAAPDLLTACEAMVHAAEQNDPALGGVAATLADAAVRKARGQ